MKQILLNFNPKVSVFTIPWDKVGGMHIAHPLHTEVHPLFSGGKAAVIV